MVTDLLTCRTGSCSVEFIDSVGRAAAPDTLTGWCLQMEMLIGGRWQPAASGQTEDVTSPFDWESAIAQANGTPYGPAVVKHGPDSPRNRGADDDLRT